jgi:exonuclease SbcC
MNINSIELEGYGSYKDYTYIPINNGITGIIGSFDGNLNKSNGVGKTSIVMSILYALFGEGEADTISEFINDESEEMYVRIKYKLNGVDYTVERGIRKKTSYLECYMNNDKNNRLGDNIKTTQAAIINTIGMDYNMLTASNFFEQSGMDKFINTEPGIRRNYIDKVIQLEIWRKVLKEITSDIKKEDDIIFNTQTQISLAIEEIEKIDTLLKDKDKLQTDIIEINKKQFKLKEDIDKYNQIKYINSTLKSNKSILEFEIKRFETNEKSIYSLNIDKYDLTKELNDLLVEPASLKYKKEYDIFIKDIEDSINTIVETIKNIKSEININTQKLYSYEADLKYNKSQLNKIISGKCPTCKQEVNIELLEKENEDINKNIININNNIAIIKNILLEKEAELKDFESKLLEFNKNLKETIDKINKINSEEIQRKASIELKQSKITLNTNQILSLENEQKLSKEKISSLELDIKELNNQIKDINITEQEYNYNISELNKYTKQLDQINFNLGILKEKEEQKQILINDKISDEILLKEMRENKKYDEVLQQIFSEIPRQLFNSSISSIEELANDLIHQIMPEISVTIYEDTSKKSLPIVIGFEVNGKYRSYKRLSGGQRTIVNIGIRLGFSRVIAMQSQSNIKFIVMDEPFGSLDEENRALIKKILTLISNYFNQILIITHTEDSDSFPNVINVRMSSEYKSYIVN